MIREQIYKTMVYRGLSQTDVSRKTGCPLCTFNQYLCGRRSLPYHWLIAVMKLLRITIGRTGSQTSGIKPEEIQTALRRHVKLNRYKTKDISQRAGINYCVLASFFCGNRTLPPAKLEQIMTLLGYEIVKYKEGENGDTNKED